MYSIGECGHAFCSACLQQWFQTCLDNALRHRAGVPAEWKHNSGLSLRQARAILVFLMRKRMPYVCPVCRCEVKKKPVSVIALNHLMEAVSEAFGAPSADEAGPEAELQGFSVGYFLNTYKTSFL